MFPGSAVVNDVVAKSQHLLLTNKEIRMMSCSRTVSAFLVLAVLAGCASTNVIQQTPMSSPGPEQHRKLATA
jgi:hypothetical protein